MRSLKLKSDINLATQHNSEKSLLVPNSPLQQVTNKLLSNTIEDQREYPTTSLVLVGIKGKATAVTLRQVQHGDKRALQIELEKPGEGEVQVYRIFRDEKNYEKNRIIKTLVNRNEAGLNNGLDVAKFNPVQSFKERVNAFFTFNSINGQLKIQEALAFISSTQNLLKDDPRAIKVQNTLESIKTFEQAANEVFYLGRALCKEKGEHLITAANGKVLMSIQYIKADKDDAEEVNIWLRSWVRDEDEIVNAFQVQNYGKQGMLVYQRNYNYVGEESGWGVSVNESILRKAITYWPLKHACLIMLNEFYKADQVLV